MFVFEWNFPIVGGINVNICTNGVFFLVKWEAAREQALKVNGKNTGDSFPVWQGYWPVFIFYFHKILNEIAMLILQSFSVLFVQIE